MRNCMDNHIKKRMKRRMEKRMEKRIGNCREKESFMQRRLSIFLIVLTLTIGTGIALTGCAKNEDAGSKSAEQGARSQEGSTGVSQDWETMTLQETMNLRYATQFSVEKYEGGYEKIVIGDADTYLVVPEQAEIPQNVPETVTVICRPLSNIYLSATSAMDLFRSLDAIDQVTLSGTQESGWYIEEAKQAMESGAMTYAGKYSAPDYELILSKSCDLAIESTMITHSPEVKEQLQKLGIPVLVERSSYEKSPLGRMEWIKLYGVLLGKEEEAEACFEEKAKEVEQVVAEQASGKTATFFYISSNGYANVRKPGDYISEMIRMAGGIPLPQNIEDNGNALSTMNMQMEAFYAEAKDADYLIYNNTIDGELESLSELLAKSSLLSGFKAVKEGHVWCTGKNMFQESMGLGDMILDMHRLFTEEEPDPAKMTYLHPLK